MVPLLRDMSPTDLTSPLKEFQAVALDKEGLLKTLAEMNTMATSEAKPTQVKLRASFEKWWPDLEAELEVIRHEPAPKQSEPRKDRELLEEILGLVREMGRNTPSGGLSGGGVLRAVMPGVEGGWQAIANASSSIPMEDLAALLNHQFRDVHATVVKDNGGGICVQLLRGSRHSDAKKVVDSVNSFGVINYPVFVLSEKGASGSSRLVV